MKLTIITNYMLFLCFSSKDRQSLVESLLYHLDNYAIPVWYDRRVMLMGDHRNYKNFIEGVDSCDYAVIVLSPNSIASICANEEIDLIKARYEKRKMVVFPIFFNITAKEIPIEYNWLTELVYKELTPSVDAIGACNHIVCKLLLDELNQCPIRTIEQYTSEYEHVPIHTYLVTMIKSYLKINSGNYYARITLLYSACLYLRSIYIIKDVPRFYYEGIFHLFELTKLSLALDQREVLIAERSFLLLLNSIMSGTFIQD